MSVRVIEKETLSDIRAEMQDIGVDSKGIDLMSRKGLFKLVKIEKIKNKAANLIKQDMLSVGGEAAVNYTVADFKEEFTDVLLMGTLQHYTGLIEHLKRQPFGLKNIAEEIDSVLNNCYKNNFKIKCGKYLLDLKEKVRIMGVLNITPDSFSDGGKYFNNKENAIGHAEEMVKNGADIIDIGGESSRPGAEPVLEEEEKKRVIPIIKELVKRIDVPISIDTYKPNIAREAVEAGATLINDISGLSDKDMVGVVKDFNVPVVIMHMQGKPKTMQQNPHYDDVVGDIMSFFKVRIKEVEDSGVDKENIILDPGIGFGKTTRHNLAILKNLKEFKSLGFPLLLGTSRKRFIGEVLGLSTEERLAGSLSSGMWGAINGANILRAHDVLATARALRMIESVLSG